MLTIFSLDHRQSTAAEREPFMLGEAQRRRLGRVTRRAALGQVALLTTCNRVALITWLADGRADRTRLEAVVDRLLPRTGLAFLHRARRLEGLEAIGHLHRVAAGLESQLCGDSQVLGQVRTAYQEALVARTIGPELHRLFQSLLGAGKRVRHETALGRRAASVGAVAATWLLRQDPRRLLLVGAGRTIEEAGRILVGGSREVTIVNRRGERGAELAARLGAGTADWEDRHLLLARADAAIVATSAAEPVILAGALRQARGAAAGQLRIVDLGVPRNVAAAVADVPCVELTGLDVFHDPGEDLAERHAAHAIVSAAAYRCGSWLALRGAGRQAVA